MSRKHRIHSRFYWFTEFCNSQCLSHFAAPFISVQAKTFITEGCKIIDRGRIPQWIENSKECMTVKQNRCNTHEVCHPSNPDCPGNSPRSTESKFISKESLTDNVHSEILDACEWSFRRFTYGNLVTTSPSSKWWGSPNFPQQSSGTEVCCSPNYSPNHSIGRSDGRCVQRAGT